MDVKGEVRAGNPCKNLSTNAENWDGVVSSSEEDSLKELERRDHIFNNWNDTPRKLEGLQ